MSAEDCYQQSSTIWREFKDRLREGTTLNNLALVREAQGDIAGALEFGRQAIAVLEKTEDKAALAKVQLCVAEREKKK